MFHSYTCIFSPFTVTGFHLWGAVVATGVVCTFYCTLVCQEYFLSFHLPTCFAKLKIPIVVCCSLGCSYLFSYSYLLQCNFFVRNIQSGVKFNPSQNFDRSYGTSSSSKAGRLETRELTFPCKSKGWKRLMSQLKQSGKGLPSHSAFLFCSVPQQKLRPTHIRRRTICFTQPTDSNISLNQKHPHRHIENNVC